MAAPRARKCPREGCTFGEDGGPYVTDPACSTLQEVRDDLRDHLDTAHDDVVNNLVKLKKADAELALAQAKEKDADARKIAAGRGESGGGAVDTVHRGERRTPLVRPLVQEDMTEMDWSFFAASWERYAQACRLEPGEEVSHLWSACSDSLQKTLHNKGAGAEKDKVKLLDTIKQLAVKKRNNLVNVIAFQQMCQERDKEFTGSWPPLTARQSSAT